jgi:hypothetical protein
MIEDTVDLICEAIQREKRIAIVIINNRDGGNGPLIAHGSSRGPEKAATAMAITKRSATVFDKALVKHSRPPMRIILSLLALSFVLPFLELPAVGSDDVEHAISLLLIAAIAWLIVQFMDILQDVAIGHYRIDVSEDLLK